MVALLGGVGVSRLWLALVCCRPAVAHREDSQHFSEYFQRFCLPHFLQVELRVAFADRWLKRHAEVDCKPSTSRSYEQLLRLHVKPCFGNRRLSEITRESVKQFLAELSCATRVVNEETGETAPKYSRNTLRLVVCALRTVLNAAVEDGVLESNPAARVGRFAKSEKPVHQASAMTRDEAESFLAAVREVCPDWYPFFLTALRTGLRRGELIALKWGDIQFGEDESDPNRYILVQRNYVCGRFTSPKSKKSRRADLSKQLRRVLLEMRDKHMLEAFLAGKTSLCFLPRPGRQSSPTTSPSATCTQHWRRLGCGTSASTTFGTRLGRC